MISLPPLQEMERAFQSRDIAYDGVFFLGVRTTGVFCRPSCPARKPLVQNVEYFASARDAIFAGYRPCKRCRPLEINGRPPDWIGQLLARVDQDPGGRLTDADIRAMGVDPARVRRFFIKEYGMTFHAYARGRRMGKALEQIRLGADLDDVALGYGYESHSGFREAFGKTFGRPPGKSKNVDCIVTGMVETPLGPMVIAATSRGVCLVEFTSRRMLEAEFSALRRLLRCAIVPGTNEHLEQLRDELTRYFSGDLMEFRVPLLYPGSAFQQAVWDSVRRIPYGATRSYESLAHELGRPGAARAVGSANGCNRISILIPCHRVLNKDGKLGGYGGGLWRKQALLDLERQTANQRNAGRLAVELKIA